MTIRELEALIAEAVNDVELRPEEIPAIDLYLDQITSLVAEKQKQGAERFEERALTKTMINNYSKDGLLTPIKGKKYSKEHILQMLLVYEMKNTLSIGEIKRVLQSIYSLPDYSPALLERIYVRYVGVKEEERRGMRELVALLMEQNSLSVDGEEDLAALILSLSAMSSYLKTVVQLLIEVNCPDLDEERAAREREKKEEAKRRRAEQKAEKKNVKEKDGRGTAKEEEA